ncbi:hypothetical protein L9F63_011157, partial [Diploptera punctata]
FESLNCEIQFIYNFYFEMDKISFLFILLFLVIKRNFQWWGCHFKALEHASILTNPMWRAAFFSLSLAFI